MKYTLDKVIDEMDEYWQLTRPLQTGDQFHWTMWKQDSIYILSAADQFGAPVLIFADKTTWERAIEGMNKANDLKVDAAKRIYKCIDSAPSQVQDLYAEMHQVYDTLLATVDLAGISPIVRLMRDIRDDVVRVD